MDQKTQRSRAFPPTLCHGVARIFLTAPLSYDAVALHRGQCEQLLRYVKLATSSIKDPWESWNYQILHGDGTNTVAKKGGMGWAPPATSTRRARKSSPSRTATAPL